MVLHVQLQDMQDIYIPIPCITLFSYLGIQYYSPTGTVTSLSPRVLIVHISTPEHLKMWRVQEWKKYLQCSKHINNRAALSLSLSRIILYITPCLNYMICDFNVIFVTSTMCSRRAELHSFHSLFQASRTMKPLKTAKHFIKSTAFTLQLWVGGFPIFSAFVKKNASFQ